MSNLKNYFVTYDDESVNFFYIKTETAWSFNIEVFYEIIEEKYNNEIKLYALIEEDDYNIFINTDEKGIYFYPKYKLDAFIDDNQVVKYFETFHQVVNFIRKNFSKVKSSSKDTIELIIKKITKAYKVNDDEDFYINIHQFSSMYPF